MIVVGLGLNRLTDFVASRSGIVGSRTRQLFEAGIAVLSQCIELSKSVRSTFEEAA